MSTRYHRLLGSCLTATLLSATLGTGVSAASPPENEVDAEFECTRVQASSNPRELSNVVLEFADGDRQRFEGLSGNTQWFEGTVDDAGERITTIWIKAGDNHSDDGPGYGERFDSPLTAEDCTTGSGTSADDSTADEDAASGDGTSDEDATSDEDEPTSSGDEPTSGDDSASDGDGATDDGGTPQEDGSSDTDGTSEEGTSDDRTSDDDGTSDDDSTADEDRTVDEDAEQPADDEGAQPATGDDAAGDETAVDGSGDAASSEDAAGTTGADTGDADVAAATDEVEPADVLGTVVERPAAGGTDATAAGSDGSDVAAADAQVRELPRTGSDSTTLALLAALAVVAGAVAVTATRRRPTVV